MKPHALRMAARAAQRVPWVVHPGYVLTPRCEPLAVPLGDHTSRFTWTELASHWGLDDLAGVVASPQVRCSAWVQGRGAFPGAGTLGAWKPGSVFLSDGMTLFLAGHKPGAVLLYALAKDATFVRPKVDTSESLPPLPGLLKGDRMQMFD
jgi:hypothetical protein